jgi:hypothetical protein
MFANTKRMKVAVEVVKSVDPLQNLHEHNHSLILQHLKNDELLNICLVSPKWNEIISNSPDFLRKFKFGFSQIPWTDDWPDKTLELLKRRKYRHVNGHFIYMTIAVKVLKLLEKSSMAPVELDVAIDSENGFYGRCPLESFKFPSVETLNVQHVLSSALKTNLIVSAPRLKKLSIDSIMSADLIKCVKSLKDLKDLELYGLREYLFKQNSLHTAKFSLRSLKITDSSKLSKESSTNFKEFLKKMANSLVSLQMDHSYLEDIEVIFNRMPKLRRVTMRIIREDCSSLQLAPNRCIREMRIIDLSETFKRIILTLKHLEILHIEVLNPPDVQWIDQNLKKLKRVSFRFLRLSCADQVRLKKHKWNR